MAGSATVPYRVKYPLPTLSLFNGMAVSVRAYALPTSDYPLIAQAGFNWIRVNLTWSAVEYVQGKYDFSTYDQLVANAQANGLRVHFIFDGGNTFYTGSNSALPTTTTGINGFANFVSASVAHYREQGLMWELLNEPDLTALTPAQYVALMNASGQALRATSPNEWFVGPAVSNISRTTAQNYLLYVLQNGAAAWFDAITVHPYRTDCPETARQDLATVQTVIAQNAPVGKYVPLFAGEWGYNSSSLPLYIAPSNFSTGAPNILQSTLNFSPNSYWSGYWGAKPPIQTGVSDPFGGTAATRFLTYDCTNSAALGTSGVDQPGTETTGNYYTVSCWLRSEGAPFTVYMGLDDSACTGFVIDNTWRRYAFTFYCSNKWNQKRVFQVFEKTIGNPNWDIYGPQTENLGVLSSSQIQSAQAALEADYYQRMYMTTLQAGVPYLCMYEWKESTQTPGFGLVWSDSTPKPAYSGLVSFYLNNK